MIELADRLASNLDDLGMAVTQDGAHLARGEIEDPAAVGVGEVVAGRALGDQRRECTAIAHEMGPCLLPELGIAVAGHDCSCRTHACSNSVSSRAKRGTFDRITRKVPR